VGIQAEIANTTSEKQETTVRFEIVNADGIPVAFESKQVELGENSKSLVNAVLRIEHPLFWEPGFPHLYRVSVATKTNSGFRDLASVPYAPRVFRWHRDTGFWINGQNLKLHGWGHKPTGAWAGLGAALPNWLRDYTLRQMWEAGGNMIRWGHCAGSASEVRFSEKYGFVTLMPGVDGERDCEGKAWQTRKSAFRDTIIYFRNHPSILMWEGGNYNISVEHTRELREVMDQWDPYGKRYFGFRMSTSTMLPYIDIEVGTVGRRRALPMLPVVESEYDRMEAPRRLWDAFSPPYFGFMGKNQELNTYQSDSEMFAVNAVKEWWNLFERLPNHSGGANWIFNDEPHGTRQVTDVARSTGEVDGVRLPKPSYFVLQTMWRGEPAAFLIGHWNYPENTRKTMYAVIAGAERAELFVNGRSLGEGTRSNHYLFEWSEVACEPGAIKVVATDAHGQVVAEDSLETAGEPHRLKLTPIVAPGGWRADGVDVALVDVEVVDHKGRRCPTAHPRVHFELEGAGIWRGGYNSGREYSTNHLFLDLECGINRVSIRSTRDAGTVTLRAKSEGLEMGSITLESEAFEALHGLSAIDPQEYEHALPEAPQWDAGVIEREILLAAQPRIVEKIEKGEEKIFSSYHYTGIGKGEAEASVLQSTLAYTDSALHYIDKVPLYLEDCYVIRTALKDASYWANDYIVATVAAPIELFIAHDSRIEVPEWLLEFQGLDDTVTVGGHQLRLYRRVMQTHEELRIPGAADQGKAIKSALNIVMFGKPLGVDPSRNHATGR
jgi:beta-galactosidase